MKLIILLLFLTIPCQAKMLKIAVLDTGLDLNDPRFKNVLCKTGHKDFTGEGIDDKVGHGTHIVGLIKQYAENSKYCILIFKYFKESLLNNSKYIIASYKEAIKNNVKIINMSGGGNNYLEQEENIIKQNPKIIFNVAAGNDGKDIDEVPYYPATFKYKNVIAIGNLNKDGKTRNESSNYGSDVKTWEIGTNVLSTLPNGKEGKLTGTSMSAAIHAGKLIKELYDNKHY